ncbi:hypothetical protein F751_4618 [Auxenochlorella protothecoides]|uniref:Uncharacterized protein n=1 Tax=Auxenochlorella protothecoides TaxID=3075 RepID=A0A087SNP4_AUXPR|nr:hypothetical protein F751_4618 [Auxenochlorella protothecoides]KFM27348.1 hypothetical protein F751_4618 [Auxenochlorella protothecoides]RMZ57510.1 hypothetical protein APUTEX25_003753 [Auxenochlorella protothecoides]|eukprot:RMZ57510.1 hypothetical protein APUTEX25_003753 [Auxenochlorella protothecoides]
MCGPIGSVFGLAVSAFGIAFLSFLAILIRNDYPYVGEWFEPKGEGGEPPVPIAEQRAAAEHGLWVAVAIYAVLLIISSLSVCLHRVRGTL